MTNTRFVAILTAAAAAVVAVLVAANPAAASAATPTGVIAHNPTSLSGFQNLCPAGQHVEIFAYAAGIIELDWTESQVPGTPVHSITFDGNILYHVENVLTSMEAGYWSIHAYPFAGHPAGINLTGSGAECHSY